MSATPPPPRPRGPCRRRKPARLWYDAAKDRWLILDGTRRINTGCRRGEGDAAQQALIRHIEAVAAETTGEPAKKRPPARVSVAEVISHYLDLKSGSVARPRELGQRATRLLEFWGDSDLEDIDGATCREFWEEVGSPSYARRMLADLQAAINLYVEDGYLTVTVKVKLPGAPEARQDFLTYEEAMVLLRMMRSEKLDGRYPWRHLIPYFAVSLVTCSRASRVFRASFVAEKGRPLIDPKTGLYTRMHSGEKKTKKRAPAIQIEGRLLAAVRSWARPRTVDGVEVLGLRYVCQYEGRAVDPKRSFATILRHAAKRRPDLFRRPDGEPKELVRHSLRHTGITWMALAGVDPYAIIRYAGITMKVFEDVYSHSFPGGLKAVHDWQRKAARALE